MRFDRLVEQRIREAMDAGEFDRLEGVGRPLDLDAYFAAPEELRAGFALLKNAGVIPEEAQLLREAEELRREMEECGEEGRRASLRAALDEKMLKYHLLCERYRHGRKKR